MKSGDTVGYVEGPFSELVRSDPFKIGSPFLVGIGMILLTIAFVSTMVPCGVMHCYDRGPHCSNQAHADHTCPTPQQGMFLSAPDPDLTYGRIVDGDGNPIYGISAEEYLEVLRKSCDDER